MEKVKYLYHLSHLSFASIGVFILVLLNIFRGSPKAQFLILAMFVMLYVFWGAVHHITDKTIRVKIVLEYILFGAIVLFILQLLLL